MKKIIKTLLACSLLTSANVISDDYQVIQIYSQDELNVLIKHNQHLQRVKKDDCQLIEDIKAHALKVKEPSYVFLWGDMLAWGVCVDQDPELGMHYIEQSAKQGLLAAIEQLGRYYDRGIFVQPNKPRAIIYFREAALQGNLNAQLGYIELLIQGYGSPVDYEDAYRALFHKIVVDKKVKAKAATLLAKLAQKMPERVVDRAQQRGI